MSDYETKENRQNIIVGIFVVVAICTLIWLIWMFKDLPIRVNQARSYEIIVQVPKAPGVQENTPVRLGGYSIGRVLNVMAPTLLEDLDTGKVYYQTRLKLGIEKKFQNIPSNAEISVMTRGLGSSFVEVTIDPEKLPAPMRDPNDPESIFFKDGMVVQGGTGMTSEFFPQESQEKLDQLADRLITLLNNANDIIGDKGNKENIKASLANFSKATEEASKSLEEFRTFITAGKVMSEDLGKVANQIQFILEKVNSGQGTAAKFINDGRLYEELLLSTQQLDSLLQELRKITADYQKKGIRLKLF